MVLKIFMKLCAIEPDIEKTFYAPEIGEMGQNRIKIGFFGFKENFGY